MVFYNDFDANACKWLEELIREGLIPPGKVDNRSIKDIKPHELKDYDQCHFFAGIGGWSEALRLAGWEPDRPVWTGSCPCQPLSCAGLGKGAADERHLWPTFYELISECDPPVVFGEQVASKLGREWFAGIRLDLEAAGYACGGANLPAASVGAPHKRERLFWVADSSGNGTRGETGKTQGQCRESLDSRAASLRQGNRATGTSGTDSRSASRDERLADSRSRRGAKGLSKSKQRQERHSEIPDNNRQRRGSKSMGDSASERRRGEPEHRGEQGSSRDEPWGPGAWRFWDGAENIPCRDGKTRRIEPGISPLAHGIQGRVALLRGPGNAIIPQVAAAFILSFCETQ